MYPIGNLLNWFIQFLAPKTTSSQQPINCLSHLEKEAIVEQIIQPGKTGQVRYRGSWWLARCEQEIKLEPGEIVWVISRQNLTLLVMPVPKKTEIFSPDATPRV